MEACELMVRLAISVGLILSGLASTAHAQGQPEIDGAVACLKSAGCTTHPELLEGLAAAARDASVSESDLLGALNSLWDAGIDTDAQQYLDPPERSLTTSVAVAGGRTLPVPTSGWPIDGALGQRLYCVEGIESHHGRDMYNPTPWRGEHAAGWLGFLPSTATKWGAEIGNRWSEWNAAARMIAVGQGRQFFGISAGIC
jgi:hypothetical protein